MVINDRYIGGDGKEIYNWPIQSRLMYSIYAIITSVYLFICPAYLGFVTEEWRVLGSGARMLSYGDWFAQPEMRT